jgi:type IV conjugative transfer system protein TraL
MTKIESHVNDPTTIFFWEIDEVIVIASCTFLGIMIGKMFSLLLLGFFLSYILKRIKRKSAEGVMMHFLYWHGFLKLRGCPPSYMREFVS